MWAPLVPVAGFLFSSKFFFRLFGLKRAAIAQTGSDGSRTYEELSMLRNLIIYRDRKDFSTELKRKTRIKLFEEKTFPPKQT